MGNLLKKCPFCANEINVEAVKCQYCGEFLNNREERKIVCNDCQKAEKKHNKKWILIILLIVIVLFGFLYSNLGKQIKMNLSFNKAINYLENSKSFGEIKENLDNIKTLTPDEELLINEAGEVMNTVFVKIQSIDSGLLYLEPIDYKNKNKLKDSIAARNLYDTYFQEYVNQIDDLFEKYRNVDTTGTGKYSLGGLLEEMKNLSSSVTLYKDKIINFYNYVLTIQDDFSIGDDGQVYFYSGGSKMNKYNQLLSELYDIALNFYEDFNNYMDYMDKYNRYWNL